MSSPPSPCIVTENENIGLQDAVDKHRKRSSILKMPKSPARPALQDLDINQQEDDTKRRLSRRVSFAEKYQIKEYLTDSVSLCFWNDTQEKPVPHSDESASASSESDPSMGSQIHGLETLLSGKIHCSDECPDVFEDTLSIAQTLVDDLSIGKKRKGSLVLTQRDSRALHASTAAAISVTSHKDKKRKVLTPIDGQPASVDDSSRSHVIGDKTMLLAEDMDMTYKDCTVTKSIAQNLNVDMNLLTLNRTCCDQDAMEFTYIDQKTVHTTLNERIISHCGNKTILFTETGACDMSVTTCFEKSFINVSQNDSCRTDESISEGGEGPLGDSEESCPGRSSVSGVGEASDKFYAQEILKHFQCNIVNSLPGSSDLSALGDRLQKGDALTQLHPAQGDGKESYPGQSSVSGISVASEKCDANEVLKHFQCNVINSLPGSSDLSALGVSLQKSSALTQLQPALGDCVELCPGQSPVSAIEDLPPNFACCSRNGLLVDNAIENVSDENCIRENRKNDAYKLETSSVDRASPLMPTVNFFPPVRLSTRLPYDEEREIQTNLSETNCMVSATNQPDEADCVDVTKYSADDMEPTECVGMNAVFSNGDELSPYYEEGYTDLAYTKHALTDMEETHCATVGIHFPFQYDNTSTHPKVSRRHTMIFDNENADVEMTGVVDATIVVAMNKPVTDDKENKLSTGPVTTMTNTDKENVSSYGNKMELDTFNTRKNVCDYREATLLGLEELKIDSNMNPTTNVRLTCEPKSVRLQEAELALNIMSNHKVTERSVQSSVKFSEPAFQDVSIDVPANCSDVQCNDKIDAPSTKHMEHDGICGEIVSLETLQSSIAYATSKQPMETCDESLSNRKSLPSPSAVSSPELPLLSTADDGIASRNLWSKESVPLVGNSLECVDVLSRKRSLLQNIDDFSCQNVLKENSTLENKRCKEQKLDVEISSIGILASKLEQVNNCEKNSTQADFKESRTLGMTSCPAVEYLECKNQTVRSSQLGNLSSALCQHEILSSVFEKSVQQSSMYASIDNDVRRCCQELVLALDTSPVLEVKQIQGHNGAAQFVKNCTEENEALEHSTSYIKDKFTECNTARKSSKLLALNSTTGLVQSFLDNSAKCYSQSSATTCYPIGVSKEYCKESILPLNTLAVERVQFDASQTSMSCMQRNEEIKANTCIRTKSEEHKPVSDVTSDFAEELPDVSAKIVSQSNPQSTEDVEEYCREPVLSLTSSSVPLVVQFPALSGAAPEMDFSYPKEQPFPIDDIKTDSNYHDPFVFELAPVCKNLAQPTDKSTLNMDVNRDSRHKIKDSSDLPNTNTKDEFKKMRNVKVSPVSQADTSMAPLWSLSQHRSNSKARKKMYGNDADATKCKTKCRIKLSSRNSNAATTVSSSPDKNSTARLSDVTIMQEGFKPTFNSTMVKDLFLPRSPEENVSIFTEYNSPLPLCLTALQASPTDCKNEQDRLDMPTAATSSFLLKLSEASPHQETVEAACKMSSSTVAQNTVDILPRSVIMASPLIADKNMKSDVVADEDELMHDERPLHSGSDALICSSEKKTREDTRQIVCMAPSTSMSQKFFNKQVERPLVESNNSCMMNSDKHAQLKETAARSLPCVDFSQVMHKSEQLGLDHEIPIGIQLVETEASVVAEKRTVKDKGYNQSLGYSSDVGSEEMSKKIGDEQMTDIKSSVGSGSIVCERETKIQEESGTHVEVHCLQPTLVNPVINKYLQTTSGLVNHSTAVSEVITVENQLPGNCPLQAVADEHNRTFDVENCAALIADTCSDQKILPEQSSMHITKLLEHSAVDHSVLMRADVSSMSLSENSLLDISQLPALDFSFDRRSIPIAALDYLSSVSCLPVAHSPLMAIEMEAELVKSAIKVVEPAPADKVEANDDIALPETEEQAVFLDEDQIFEELCNLLKTADATVAIADLAECSLNCMKKDLPSASDLAILESLDQQILLNEKRLKEVTTEKEQTLRSLENVKKKKSELEAEVKACKADIIHEDKEIEKLEAHDKELEEQYSLTRWLVGFNLERADSSGVSITYMWGSLCLDVVYGEALTATTIHPTGFPLHKIRSMKLGVRKAALSPLMVLAHNMVLKAVDQTLFDSVHTSWELYKVIDKVSLLSAHSRWLTEDIDKIANHIMDIQEDKIVVEFSNMVVHAMFSISFPLVPGDYPEDIILPTCSKILGKDLESDVLEVLHSVKPGGSYLKNMVQAVDDLLKHTANCMHNNTITR